MAGTAPGPFTIEPSPDYPGWVVFRAPDADGFNEQVLGPLRVRRESESTARVRIDPRPRLANVRHAVHGGALLGLIDVSLFAALAVVTGRDPADGLTLDVSCQFIAAASLDRPLDAVVELLRETRRLAFLRGTVEQDGTMVAAFQGTVRKLDRSA